MKKFILIAAVFALIAEQAFSQIDSTLLRRVATDTAKAGMNMDAIYDRPFLHISNTPVSIGGYAEINYQHLSTDGVSDGHEFQFRRMSLMIASSITKRIKFLSEIEFENDKDEQLEGSAMEIGIEYAALDFEFHPLFNLRAGIVINPIGGFNQNHDGPKWEFTDRPIASTQMLPATFSNAGFGFFGKRYSQQWMFGYEFYLTNGLDNTIIDNDLNKTYVPHAKENPARFSASNSGEPMITGKLAVRNNKVGELGLSWMGGVYNKYQQDGVMIDEKRRCDIVCIDFNTTAPKLNTAVTGEFAWVFVQVPKDYFEQFGTRQSGGFIDIVQPVVKKRMLGWEDAAIYIALRAEYVDWNIGTFKDTGRNIADDLWSLMPAISFRPTPQTVVRWNYRFMKQQDIAGNPPATTGGFIIGISSYF